MATERDALGWLMGGLGTGGVAAIATGASFEAADEPRGWWYVIGGFLVLAAVVIYLWVYVWWPFFRRAERKRVHKMNSLPPPATVGGALRIQSAHYGIDDTWVDVTEVVRSHVRDDDTVELQVSNDHFGDPLPNRGKILKVAFDIDGKDHQLEISELQTLKIPPP